MTDMVKLKIDGKEFEVSKGTTILRASLDNGIHIPHFCYHPALSISGNCRMCLVKASNSPKLVTSCSTPVTDGIEVETNTPEIKKTRKSIMEFFLINHPLDCPICDQAGECTLQDYSYDYGNDHSRFTEEKNTYHTKDLGPLVKIWGNRCILCSRCVRFCQEIAGTGELAITNRGDRNVIDIFPNHELNNPLSGNTVDICPVGSLISKDFLYQARVWFMQQHNGLCVGCARGCNIRIDTYKEKVKRFKPRLNPNVNDYWICDEGRLSYKNIYSSDRLTEISIKERPSDRLSLNDAIEYMNTFFNSNSQNIGGLISAHSSNEEVYLFDRLINDLKGSLYGYSEPSGSDWVSPSGFKISADKNPNRRGLLEISGVANTENSFDELTRDIKEGKIDTLIIFNPCLNSKIVEMLSESLSKLKAIVYLGATENDITKNATISIPIACFAEKSGSYINEDGMIQKSNLAISPLGAADDGILVLQMLLGSESLLPAHAIFEKISKENSSINGLTYNKLGEIGTKISGE